jgi:hypothetical protein
MELLKNLHRYVFEHPAVGVVLAAGCFVLYGVFALDLTYLHDEGIFTLDMAGCMIYSPAAMLFFVKAKPVLMLIYTPFAALGLTPYLLFHAALAALAVALIVRTAVHLGIAHPGAAGWLLALSFGFTIGGSNGFANVDGAFFLSLFLFLYFSRRYLWAGGVLGLMPLVRNELALVWVAFIAWDVWNRKDYRFVLAGLAFPVVYAVAGSVYHGNIAWLVSTFPNPQSKPQDIGFELPTLKRMGKYIQQSMLLNLGVMAFPALSALKAGDRRGILLLVLTWLFFILMAFFQYFGVFGFDLSLRYHLSPLPLVALLCAYGLSSYGRAAWVGAGCAAVLMVILPGEGKGFLVAVAVLAVAHLVTRWKTKLDVVRPSNLVLWIIGVCLLVSGISGRQYGEDQHRWNHRVMDSLKKSAIYNGQPVYTDIHIARYDRCAAIQDVYFLANESMLWELSRFLNRENGQYGEIVRALAHQRFVVEPEAHKLRLDAIYLLIQGPRMERWQRRIESAGPKNVRIGTHTAYYWPQAER